MTTLADKIEALAKDATPGDLTTAQLRTDEGWLECPICEGSGEVEYADYCNFDHKALGVQFYGIGKEFGAHEKLWSLMVNNLPTILRALRERDQAVEALREVKRLLSYASQDAVNEAIAQGNKNMAWHKARTTLASIEGTGHE